MVRRTSFLLVVTVLCLNNVVISQDKNEMRERRQKVINSMEPNSILVLKGNDTPKESFAIFRQENNFYYLTRVNEPNSALVLSNVPQMPSEILFITPQNTAQKDWDALTLGEEGAKNKLGFTTVSKISDFATDLPRLLRRSVRNVYTSEKLMQDKTFLGLTENSLSFRIAPASPLITPLRRIKSETEIDLLKKAIAITVEGHKEMMRAAEPGMMEFNLAAVGEYVFKFNGARRVGYGSIVGSGKNSTILHWNENTKQMKDGEVVVVDMGAEYKLYTADVTRSFPVNGKFTKRQKEVYEILVAANEAGINKVKPGVSWRELSNTVNQVLVEGLTKIGLIEDASELRNYYYHGLGHYIGLNVHDVGRRDVLEPGMLLTIEPGIYVREENMGFRIEDDILVTEDGHINLTKDLPKTVNEIEKLMKEKSMDFSRFTIKEDKK